MWKQQHFFFKKKKQKIFDWLRLGAGDDNAQGPD
jgi:hypothetical protein